MTTSDTFTAFADRLRGIALCESDHPAVAATALITAATSILCARFDPPTVCALLVEASRDALMLSEPAGRA